MLDNEEAEPAGEGNSRASTPEAQCGAEAREWRTTHTKRSEALGTGYFDPHRVLEWEEASPLGEVPHRDRDALCVVEISHPAAVPGRKDARATYGKPSVGELVVQQAEAAKQQQQCSEAGSPYPSASLPELAWISFGIGDFSQHPSLRLRASSGPVGAPNGVG
jgi:hypothetical protein